MIDLNKSNYIIEIRLTGDESLLIHGYTGEIMKLSNDNNNYLKSLDNNVISNNVKNENPSEDKIMELKQKGFLTDLSVIEEEEFVKKINNNLHDKNLKRNPSYMIIPSYGCNFDCSYCYEKDMRNEKGNSYLDKIMTAEMVDKICSSIIHLEDEASSDESITRDVTFYGGEPFLKSTVKIVSYVIDRFKKTGNCNFSGITNGYELNYFTELLGDENISELQVTLDGTPLEHNKRRYLKCDRESGTFEKISDNISLALDRGVNLHLRVNTDRETLQSFDQLTDHFEKSGWTGYENFSTSFAPIFNIKSEQSGECKKNNLNYGSLLSEVIKLRKDMPERVKRVVEVSQENLLDQVKLVVQENKSLIDIFKSSMCGAMTNLFIFDPHGNIYPCMENVGFEKHMIGSITPEGKIDKNVINFNKWRGRVASSNNKCRKCSYLLFCGGGCAARAEDMFGDFNASYCDGFQLFFRTKIKEFITDSSAKVAPIGCTGCK